MIHRDIKPANIWVCDDQSMKILDFGLARIADDDSGLTATGMLAGTPNYMSPEQTRGQELNGRTDLFSLGCLMYRLLTGRLPFGAATVLGTLQSIQHHHPVPVQTIRPDASDDLADITMALLEKQPANRPESAQQVIELLNQDRSGLVGCSQSLRTADVFGNPKKQAQKDDKRLGRPVVGAQQNSTRVLGHRRNAVAGGCGILWRTSYHSYRDESG